jgi:site-specific DNA-methyltransferase (adenine-specific)
MRIKQSYNPDVLSCLANLSSDEVFTPPDLANKLLDLLPAALWQDANAAFLDPCAKSGVFLREIARRLMSGLEREIPDTQARVNHILKRQVFGVALTELTALLARRSAYCSKHANGAYSVCGDFDSGAGNIAYERAAHAWKNGKCVLCGANEANYARGEGLESHAYPFIHYDFDAGAGMRESERILNMKFDVIVGNPPYQLDDGGGTGSSAIPLYHRFIQQAKKMNPRYLTMIVPSRWFAGGKGLDDFRSEMLQDDRIRKIVDYPVSSDCFPGVQIKGGVCYFLWDRDNKGVCEVKTIQGKEVSCAERPLLEKGSDIFIRYNKAVPIYKTVKKVNEDSFAENVSTRKPFGFASDFHDFKKAPFAGSVEIYANKTKGYIEREKITQNQSWVDLYKIFVTTAYGAGETFPHQIINQPFIGEPNTCCTETYIVLGTYPDKNTAENAISYVRTKFFRFFVLFKKNTQNGAKNVYSFVPMQDFSESWTDEKLYKKYGLAQEEIAFIESMIRPMGENRE